MGNGARLCSILRNSIQKQVNDGHSVATAHG